MLESADNNEENMSKLKQDYYDKKISKLVKHTSAKVSSDVEIQSAGWIYQLYKDEKLHSDKERLQRMSQHWPETKVNSYLTTLFNGLSLKDTIQLAKISTIIKKLEEDIEFEENQLEKQFLQENLDYFKSLTKKEYLVLDGQHRIEEIVKFFDNQTEWNPTQTVTFKVGDLNADIPVSGFYKNIEENIRDYLFNNTALIIVTYHTGDLQELANIFITSNSMIAMSKHEKRILNYNQTNRWLVDLCNNDVNIRDMFELIGSGMTGDYAMNKKGDTLFTAEMLLWIKDNNYENQDETLKSLLGPNRLNKKSEKVIHMSNSQRDLTKKIMRKMADGCVFIDESKLKKFSKSSLYNLFYTLAFFMQTGNFWGNSKSIDGKYQIDNIERFVKWFFDEEDARIHADGSRIKFKKPNGKKGSQLHDLSFAKHNADQKHKSKTCMKGKGGSKYTFSDYGRLRYLLEDLSQNIDELVKLGALSKLGTRSTSSEKNQLRVKRGIKLSKSDNIHLDEVKPISKGGEGTPINQQFIGDKKNWTKGNRTVRPIDNV
mgnify:FL=1